MTITLKIMTTFLLLIVSDYQIIRQYILKTVETLFQLSFVLKKSYELIYLSNNRNFL